MNPLNHILDSKRLSHKIVRVAITFIFILVWTFSPVVPVLRMPTEDGEKIKLGFETNKVDASFGNGYSYRRSITINESEVTGSGDFTDFPVLVSFFDSTLETVGNGGHVTDTQGDDIVFASDDQGASPLDFERERYNASTGEITAWVRVPTLDFNNDTVIYMFYGNSSVTSSQEDVAGTWDSNFKGVWHMDDTSTTNSDSAGTANNGTVTGGAVAGAAGKIADAYSFDGIDDVSTVTDHADLDLTNTGTIEAWMKTDNVNGSESNFSSWVSRNAPNGAGADDQSGMDSVIVGETIHYGAYMCTDTTNDFAYSTSSLNGTSFKNWDSTTFSAPTGCGASEGGLLGMDSDGVNIYYAALGVNGGTAANFQTASATPTYTSVSAWRNESDPTGSGASEGNGIDMVIVGNTAYYNAVVTTGTTENIATTSRTVGAATAITWSNANNVDFGGAANTNCSIAVDSDGDKLYRSVLCNPATEVYNLSSSTVGQTSALTWRSQTAPNGSAASEFGGMDMAAMGGRLLHAAALHATLTEAVSTASSSMATGGTLSWTSRQDGSGNPNGMSGVAGDSMAISVASDGKNAYYGVLVASSTPEAFYTASSSLPAHPIISKRNAYEMIQVGTGLAFDWAGRPYTFGTSTDTTDFDHIVVTQDGTTLNMYENGVLRRTQTTSVDFESNANNLLIGGGNRSDGTAIYFDGIVDEVRVSSSARSSDWIQTEYNNQNSTSTFYTIGAEEESAVLPTVTTNFATPGFNTASLHGVMTAGSSATEHGFAYSTDSTLSTGVSTTTLGALDGNHAFTDTITGLSSTQTYYFRAYSTNAAGTGYGSIKSFVTGNSNASRNARLFTYMRFLNGRIILNQQ